ncbi:uncharacterized protein JCM6883_000053 [Sporobolomyces salmoneus]|uniref:uncharacterized protein n=1 Tax=Sporobolomyces salmoneus TaxID=183962 RepID=UPI003171D120
MTGRSSSPFDEQAVAELEAKLARKKEKQRLAQLDQERLEQSQSKLLVADSPSPRKKRAKLDSTSTSRGGAGYFDSTLLGPPPPLPLSIFKPEASISVTRKEKPESKFASHESAIRSSTLSSSLFVKTRRTDEDLLWRSTAKSFLAKLQTEQESSKLDQLRRQRTAQRSTGFSLPPSSAKTTTNVERKESELEGLMRARKETDMKVKAKIKDSSKKVGGKSSEDEVMRDVKPSVSAMSRPKSNHSVPEKGKEKETIVERRRRKESPEEEEGDSDDSLDITDGPSNNKRKRNKDGTVIEELEMGPIDFDPPRNDPNFERIEPNSGIKLRERIISHTQVQALLSDRYRLTPSQIYSLARIDTRRQVHIDVDADFVIIGVLAWKDEIRFLNSNPLSEPVKETPEQIKRRERFKEKQDPLMKEVLPTDAKPLEEEFTLRKNKKQKKQRYIRFELIDLSTESSAASGTGQLNVMLIEADSTDTGFDEEGNEIPIYKGQSGGAYEKYWKESPGAVVAIINPAFLPYSQGRPHTLKPISADSMVVLGRAKDLTFCDTIKKSDGKKCNSWVDARVGSKCQYHVHLAVSRTGMGRAETFGNTASLKQTASIDLSKLKNSLRSSHPGSSSSSSSRKKPLPLDGPSSSSVMVQGHTTYISGGSRSSAGIVSGTRTKTSDLSALTAGGIGLPVSRGSGGFIPGVRDGPVVSEEKKKKEREKMDRERGRKELKELGKRDKGESVGGEYLRVARERERERKKKEREREEKESEKNGGDKQKQKKRRKDEVTSDSSSDEGDGEDNGSKDRKKKKERRKVFSSEAVRMIGYNPTLRSGSGDAAKDQDDDETLQQRLALEGGVRQAIKLTAPPGSRVVSGVDIDPETVAKKGKKKQIQKLVSKPLQASTSTAVQAIVNDEESDDDLFIEGGPSERIKLPVPPLRSKSGTPQLTASQDLS